ncbi:class I SAM-dependent methyltransferase [Mycobacterium sp. MYCO198283]|uniref:SAM-dependent methyltransferase n=1 Tax=Mycobacterium sp. MYCO198283 TaxID=2883505 RepID=UPI001E47EC58|nr:class I SAM-dependent methyltransferase [Mycobacterium sp. MYCO198283]MCG5431623.1 class I SAM-dependent methyltransferase [Mycobacterium sp. MYCO198283]
MTDSPYETGEYLAHNPDWHAADAPFKAQWIADILQRNSVPTDHIVEVGTGSGEILVHLADRFPNARLTGYDISPQAYAIAAPKATDRLRFHHADYLAVDAEPPDVLLAIDVFEHIDDYMSFLRALRPRAPRHLFHIPLDLSVQGLLRGRSIMGARKSIGHLHYFYKDTALATLADCGYHVVDWNYTHGAELLPNRALRTKVTSVGRRALRAVNEDFAIRLLGGASMMVLTD